MQMQNFLCDARTLTTHTVCMCLKVVASLYHNANYYSTEDIAMFIYTTVVTSMVAESGQPPRQQQAIPFMQPPIVIRWPPKLD